MEVCVDNVESAENAIKGGASRLELCSALNEGGLTPTVGLLTVIKSFSTIPVFVMLRPRGGNDFIYSQREQVAIFVDANALNENGADGFVFGALTKDRKVDEHLCQRVLDIAGRKPVTFHRAFDLVANPNESLEVIARMGFSRVLTSGQQQSAFIGMKLIKKLIDQANGRIIIMPGAGINKTNLEHILSETKAAEFHASGRYHKPPILSDDCTIEQEGDSKINLGANNMCLYKTHLETVMDMVSIYNQVRSRIST